MIKFIKETDKVWYIYVGFGGKGEIIVFEKDENGNETDKIESRGTYQFYGWNITKKADAEIVNITVRDCMKEYEWGNTIFNSYEEALEDAERFAENLLVGDDDKNGVGADAMTEFIWDEIFFENSDNEFVEIEGGWTHKRKQLFWHELYHAYRIMKGQIVDQRTEEVNATNFTNKLFVFDRNRKFYWDGNSTLWNTRGGTDKQIETESKEYNLPQEKQKSECDDGKN